MPLAASIAEFRASVAQCDSLIANAHKQDSAGVSLLPQIDRRQITIAAFLNMFIAWESFLESSLVSLMIGESTLSGRLPARHVSPATEDVAQQILAGGMRYFDFADHVRVRAIANIYFDQGYPYEPHLGALVADLQDLKTMRNACAHITSTTQRAVEALAMRVFGRPMSGITLYRMLTAVDPRSTTGGTVFATYKEKLTVAAELIVQG
jgi:hypothetical protein